MIENKLGLDNIKDILSVKGLDAILIGPYDLSASLGKTGEINNPLVEQSIEKIFDSCFHFSIPVGIHIVNPDVNELNDKIQKGYRFLAYSIDTVFLNKSSKTID